MVSRKRQHGFSLIELLIVVAIILVIAAIAIPNLLKAKQSATQTAAVSNLRTINTAEQMYQTTYGSFSATLANLGGTAATCATVNGASSTSACLLDPQLAADPATKSGYTFTAATDTSGYKVNADPAATGNHYYTDGTAVIRFNATAAAGAGDPAI